MCRILFKENNNLLFDKKELEESYKSNPDGTGIIYYDPADSLLKVKKFIKGTEFEKIYKYIKTVEKNKTYKNIAVHFRFGTGGGLGIEQIHPIKIRENMYLIHNGVSHTFDIDNQNASDTQWMARWLNKNNFALDSLNDPDNKKIYDKIFSGNKLLIMEGDKYKFINEDLGRWDKGIWKSWQDGSKYGWYQKYEDEFESSKKQLSVFDFNKAQSENTNNQSNPEVDLAQRNDKILNDLIGVWDFIPAEDDYEIFDEIMQNISNHPKLSDEEKVYYKNELTSIKLDGEDLANRFEDIYSQLEEKFSDGVEFEDEDEMEM